MLYVSRVCVAVREHRLVCVWECRHARTYIVYVALYASISVFVYNWGYKGIAQGIITISHSI